MGAILARFKPTHQQIFLHTLAVLAVLCLELLLNGNMGRVGWNERDVLPLAKQFAQPSWVPTDWYLNQPAGYRLLFQAVFGQMIAIWGFLATSIIGRLICYGLFAFGLARLGRRLGLSLLLLLLALVLFLHSGCDRFVLDRCAYEQGAIAGEWLVGALEAKAVAYSLLPLTIAFMLAGHYRLMALALGVMTSLHVLVGGWTFVAVLGWMVLNRRVYPKSGKYFAASFLIYLVASGFAIPAVLEQLTAPPVTGPLEPSYIYMALRLTHHLNSLSWPLERWIRPIVLLLLLVGSVVVLQKQRRSARSAALEATVKQTTDAIRLAQLVGIALIPFGLGLLIAPFDQQGRWLQYYLFRLGDVLLPLGTCLLLACALEQSIQGNARRMFRLVCLVLLSISLCLQVPGFYQSMLDLRTFPNEIQEVTPAWRNMTRWIRQETPKASIVISPPVEFSNFTWLTERATIAKFKFLPQNPAGILTWYERLSDLGGGETVWDGATRTKDNRDEIEDKLTAGYNQLSTAQVQALMQKYQADYFVTQQDHALELPIAHRNNRHILYARTNALP